MVGGFDGAGVRARMRAVRERCGRKWRMGYYDGVDEGFRWCGL